MLWQPDMDPVAVAGLAGTRTYPLNSSFQPTYNMAVNLVGQVGRERAAKLLESSFAQFQADRAVVGLASQARPRASQVAGPRRRAATAATSRVRLDPARALAQRERDECPAAVGWPAGRGDRARWRSCGRGDIIGAWRPRRPASRWCSSRARRGGDRPAPLVLTDRPQVKRLSLADFPVPVQAVDRMQDPAVVQPALAGGTAGPRRPPCATSSPSRRAVPAPARAGGRDGGRATPRSAGYGGSCASIPATAARTCSCTCGRGAASAARAGGRGPRPRVSGRSHVIARTFDRVCAVLDELGYIDGDKVTARGQAAGRALHRARPAGRRVPAPRTSGPGSSPAELAACVSALTFESRRPDDASPPRLPHGRPREVLAAMDRASWGELRRSSTSTGCRSCASPTSASPGRRTPGPGARPLDRLVGPRADRRRLRPGRQAADRPARPAGGRGLRRRARRDRAGRDGRPAPRRGRLLGRWAEAALIRVGHGRAAGRQDCELDDDFAGSPLRCRVRARAGRPRLGGAARRAAGCARGCPVRVRARPWPGSRQFTEETRAGPDPDRRGLRRPVVGGLPTDRRPGHRAGCAPGRRLGPVRHVGAPGPARHAAPPSALADAVCAHARAAGADRISLWVTEVNGRPARSTPGWGSRRPGSASWSGRRNPTTGKSSSPATCDSSFPANAPGSTSSDARTGSSCGSRSWCRCAQRRTSSSRTGIARRARGRRRPGRRGGPGAS